MNKPILIDGEGFQKVWSIAVQHLSQNRWECHNLVVHISSPVVFDIPMHNRVSAFMKTSGVLGPKHVAYTIFPHKLYRTVASRDILFDSYQRLFDFTMKRKKSWGTYFRRMTCYETTKGTVNQLMRITDAIRARTKMSKAGYTIIIQHPGGETVRPRGGPCLNYLAIQMAHGSPRPRLGLLAVYRNHDFLARSYGNYWGLCNLIQFLATETSCDPGPLTCISSHAFVDKHQKQLQYFVESL